jgi:general secretion pathway protein E
MAIPEVVHHPVGCSTCNGTGYAGRVGVFEILEVSETLRAAIDKGQSEMEMKRVALAPDQTLFGQSLHQVAAAKTSLAEALRVVGDAL